MVICISESTEFRKLYKKLLTQIQPVWWKKVNVLSITDTATLRVQTEIFSQVVECYRNTYTHLTRESKDKIISHMDMLLHVVRKRGKKISGQEIDDINMEIQRFHRVCQLHRLKSETEYRISCNDPEVKIGYEAAHRIAYTIEKYSAESDEELRNALENLSKVMNSAVKITDAERKEIVRAMGYKQGHWCKCPNGHIYITTECGGAVETSRCNECGEEIGGGRHRLLPTNSVATEMDGATRPAWPQ
jgi:ferritin